jgi:hypothetical protein
MQLPMYVAQAQWPEMVQQFREFFAVAANWE